METRRRGLMASAGEPVQPNDEIWYTSINGQVITPNNIDSFGANFVSNTYIEGKGIIRFDGDISTIPSIAFFEKSYLQTISIPNSVKTLVSDSFRGCWNLVSATIGNSVENIYDWVFHSCVNLIEIVIPDTIKGMGGAAFYNCSALTSVVCKATNPPRLDNAVFGETNECPIYVPAESVEAYKSASKWSDYASRIYPIQ